MLAALLVPLLGLNQTATPERARDIWVFRSVLDQEARMVSIGLSKDLWVAYDATNCGLYKVWTGGVKFDGAVYTSVHGPQPTSVGTPYYIAKPGTGGWEWTVNGNRQLTKPLFRGYRFENKQVTLNFEFLRPDGTPIRIQETPEAGPTAAGTIRFERKIVVSGARVEDEISALVAPLPAGTKLETDGQFSTPASLAGFGTVRLRRDAPTTVTFTAAKSGTPGAVHTEFPPLPAPGQQESAEREPGFSVRIYDIGKPMTQLPRLVRSQSPNVSFVGQVIDFTTKADFRGLEDNFLVHISGYLNVTKPGTYKFRLTSDDGSKFTIRDTVVVNNDGLHGATPQDGEFEMNPGEHPFFLEYFESSADNVLKLEWQEPGSDFFTLVPPSAFTTPKGEVRVTAPGTKLILSQNPGRPGDRQPLDDVHPSYRLTTIRPSEFKPKVGGIDFLPDGRMVICNWEPDGGVYVLDGVTGDADPANIKVTQIAAGLAEPLGIKVVNGEIYVLQKQELTKLIDHDRDGMIDEYYAVANGWGVTPNFHEFAFGLVYDKGHFYAALATAIDPGGASTRPQNPDRGKVVKIGRNGKYELIAHGLRTPNGIGFGYRGRIYITDNQGDWLPSSKLVEVREGAFYGSRSVDPDGTKSMTETLPVVWLPQGEIGNSPSQPTTMNDGPYRGQMLHGDVTHGGVKRVFVEEVAGKLQGCVFRFTQGLEAGVNRICWGPDGALYIGGIGSTGNWGQEGKERFGLQKIKFNNNLTFEPLAVRAKTNGMEVELTEPLAPGQGETASYYTLTRWKYVPTEQYGGPKVNERTLPIRSVTVSRDRRRVFLETDGLLANHVLYLRLHPSLTSQSGQVLWTTEAWYTLNAIPANRIVKPNPVNRIAPAGPSAEERRAGFRPIFDGKDLSQLKGWKSASVPANWTIDEEGSLAYAPGSNRGDVVTKAEYGNFELRFSWKISKAGNSGVFYRVDDSLRLPWETGPEYQILDNDEHADGINPITSAASSYGLLAPKFDMTRPIGEWNESRIIAEGNTVEHWLNGVLVLRYTLGSPSWRRLVAMSMAKDFPNYGKLAKGKIVFQDHADPVWYRNIRVREIRS